MHALALILNALNVIEGKELRADSKYTAILAKQLEYVKVKTYDIVYPAFKARQLIPVDHSADSAAETITYLQWDQFGMAQIISNYADDPPVVEVLAEEFTKKVYGMALSFTYSIMDLRRAAKGAVNLPTKKAAATRRGIEQKFENIGALGDSATDLIGIANNPNVGIFSCITGVWGTSSTTGRTMVADLHNFVAQIVIANKETFLPDTLVLDISLYQLIQNRVFSGTGDTAVMALDEFIRSSPYINKVESWSKLATADASGTGPRAIAYAKDIDVLQYDIPQEYEQMPPERKGMSFQVVAHARAGGVSFTYPLGAGYMDGLY